MKNQGKNLTLTHKRYDDVMAMDGETKREWYLQITRILASHLRYPTQCQISACRRNKFCCGRISESQRGVDDFDPLFPPCTNGKDARRQAIVDLLERMLNDKRASQ